MYVFENLRSYLQHSKTKIVALRLFQLKMFSLPLKDKGLTLMTPHFIRTWQEMQVAFLERHFPLLRRTTIQKKMMNFAPKDERDFINFGKGVRN